MNICRRKIFKSSCYRNFCNLDLFILLCRFLCLPQRQVGGGRNQIHMGDVVCTHIYIHIYLHICIHMCISCVVIDERDRMKLDRGRFALGFFKGGTCISCALCFACRQPTQQSSPTAKRSSSHRASEPASRPARQPTSHSTSQLIRQ